MVEIRPTAAEDCARLLSLQKAAFAPLYDRYHDAGNPCLRGIEDISGRIGHPVFRYFTILEDGEIIGGVLYKIAGRTPFYDPMPQGTVYLQRIYVDPARQGQGIARQAILLSGAEFPGAVRFLVDFPLDLEKNRRCYAAAGFSDTGKRLEAEPGLVLACWEKLL